MLGLGIQLGNASQREIIFSPVDLKAGAIGDSINEQMFTQFSGAGETAFETEAVLHFTGSVDIYDAANSGTFLLESTALSANAGNTNIFWVDDSGALSAGPQLTNNVTNDSNAPNCYICSLGINDNAEIGAVSVSTADVENAYDFIANTALSEQNVNFTMLNTLGRDAGGSDTGCNILREGLVNAVSNNAQIKRGIDIYDLERVDNKHLSQAGYEAKAKREAIQIGRYLGVSANQALGPQIVSAMLETDEIVLSLSHVTGTDITAPISGNGGMDATDDGGAMGAVTLSRVDATTSKLTFPDGSAPVQGSIVKLYVPFGKDGGLAAVPDVMRDNSSLALPIQSDVLNVVNGDPIQALDNLSFYIDARGAHKTMSGTEIESIDKIAGSIASASEVDAGDHGVWVSSAVNGIGAFEYQSNTQMLYTGFTAGSTHSFGFVFEQPSSVGNGDVLFFGNSGGGTDNQAKIVVAGDNRFYYANNQSSSAEVISDVQSNSQQTVIIFEFVSDDVLNVYHDGETTPSYSINPVNDFNAWNSILLGARTAGAESSAYSGLRIGAYFHTTDVLSAIEKTDIFNYWNTRFSLNL